MNAYIAETTTPLLRLNYLKQYMLRRARLGEYSEILQHAKLHDYHITSVDYWFTNLDQFQEKKVLILRHDVDQIPSSAIAIAEIEKRYSVHATFYFRWSTAQKRVIDEIREMGGTVGLHYETLSRYALINGLSRPEDITPQVIKKCVEKLKEEVSLFKSLFGEIDSIGHHGDPVYEKIKTSNFRIVEGRDPKSFGVKLFASDTALVKRVEQWISDRLGTASITDIISEGYSPILFNTHPQYWIDGLCELTHRVSKRFKAFTLSVNPNHIDLIPHTDIPQWRELQRRLFS